MRIFFSAALVLPMLLAGSTIALLPATPALALPQHPVCLVITYYNNADHDKVVGTRTSCPGSPTHMTGHTSPYRETERIEVDTGGSGHHGSGPGGLPCEFLQAGCSNLPTSRF